MAVRRGGIIIAFLAPALVFFGMFVAWPIVKLIDLSVHETNFITTTFVGLKNYIDTLRDPDFRRAMVNSAAYMAILIPGSTGGALLLALGAYRMSKGWQDAARVILYIPSLAAGLIISQLWAWVFHIEGPVNWLLGLAGLPAVSWFAKGYTAIPVIALTIILSGFGANFIILMSAMLSIDKSVFDAAAIDGANNRRVNWGIIVPIVAPAIAIVALLAAIQGPSLIYNIYALAPQNYAASMAFHIYQQGFMFSKYGTAAAQSVIFLVCMVGVALVKQRVAR
jgi:multiple sugar transport system permease protein